MALFVLVSCMLDGDKTAKRGSEVENEIHGVLVAVDGDPVQGAKVKAVQVAGAVAKRGGAAADSDSVVTDADGRYSLRGLEPGTYNLFGDYQSGDLVVLIPGVDHTDTTEPKDQGIDTLRAPGRIRGRLLFGGQGKEGVLAYVPGTSYLAVSDDSGRFVIGGVPQGAHRVSYSAAGFVIAPDTGVAVLSGKTTDLPPKQLAPDPALPPPAPTGLKAVYDTLHETVTLSWDSVPVSDLEGYVIYRDSLSFLDPRIIADGFTKGTSFRDSTLVVPEGRKDMELAYRVKSRDREANLSVSFSSPAYVTAVSRWWVTTRVRLEASGTRDGALSPGDSLRVILRYENPTRGHRLVTWRLAGSGGILRERAAASPSGADTLGWVPEGPGDATFLATVLDEAGTAWTESLAVVVLEDRPVADAGNDTLVSLGDTVRLRGAGDDRFGRIVKREWAIGGDGFREAADGVFLAAAPAAPGPWLCIFRVTDDDGLTDSDTLVIRVLQDAPAVDAGPDRRLSLGDTVTLAAAARDGFGRIIAYGWDVGGTGTFRDGDSTAAIVLPRADTLLTVFVRVTDDDGLQAADTVVVEVVRDEPVAEAAFASGYYVIGDAVRITSEDSFDSLGAIAKREWDPGATGAFTETGARIDVTLPGIPGKYPVVLRVTDDDGLASSDTVFIPVNDSLGRHWAKAAELPGIPEIHSHEVLAFKDRLWVLGGGGRRIFSSPDGFSWTETDAPTHSDDGSQAAAVFKDALWMIGGYADGQRASQVWRSPDGLAWTRMPDPPFGVLSGHKAFVLNGELFVFGGGKGTEYPRPANLDVWHTPDGISWTRSTLAANMGARVGHSVAVLGNKAFAACDLQESNGCVPGRVWVTEDGISWSEAAADAAAPFPDAFLSPLISAAGRLWKTRQNDLHVSTDGVTWGVFRGAILKSRILHGFAEFRGTLWIIGGDETAPDVWYAE